MKGMCWRVSLGMHISVTDYTWLPRSSSYRLDAPVNLRGLELVANLIDTSVMKWKEELIGYLS